MQHGLLGTGIATFRGACLVAPRVSPMEQDQQFGFCLARNRPEFLRGCVKRPPVLLPLRRDQPVGSLRVSFGYQDVALMAVLRDLLGGRGIAGENNRPVGRDEAVAESGDCPVADRKRGDCYVGSLRTTPGLTSCTFTFHPVGFERSKPSVLVLRSTS